jgi:hypothetical protein
MINDTDVTLMKKRKSAARSAMKFFKEKVGIKSTNNPFAGTTNLHSENLNAYRTLNTDSIEQSFEDAARTGVGNCDEKGRICYAALLGNPILNGNSIATLVAAINYDHVFVVVDGNAVNGPTRLSGLSQTAMIVDGWTEDWYFPNLTFIEAKMNNVGHNANPRALYVRGKISNNRFQEYNPSSVTQSSAMEGVLPFMDPREPRSQI